MSTTQTLICSFASHEATVSDPPGDDDDDDDRVDDDDDGVDDNDDGGVDDDGVEQLERQKRDNLIDARTIIECLANTPHKYIHCMLSTSFFIMKVSF